MTPWSAADCNTLTIEVAPSAPAGPPLLIRPSKEAATASPRRTVPSPARSGFPATCSRRSARRVSPPGRIAACPPALQTNSASTSFRFNLLRGHEDDLAVVDFQFFDAGHEHRL